MKRLTTLATVAALVFGLQTMSWAQSKDLAGTWLLDSVKTGKTEGPPQLVITLTDKEFTAKMGGGTSPAMVFKLDGTETPMKNGSKTKAAWAGNKLQATVVSPEGVAETVTFSREGAWLLMEGNHPEHGPMKIYFKKESAR